ncbi:M10 family metallopeptidase C-terminal domain-containing protein [Loktanella salsilacus]|uniref:M10 family metallopeptidase C-terminal domain-containing protein n=1 Tax=Loktanella salsilacus TaxID=195913 RepID=UPI0037365ECF
MPDIAASVATTAEMSVGDVFYDYLEQTGDRDWIAIDLADGQTVDINLHGLTSYDTYLRLYDSNGQLVAENDDFGAINISQITYRATEGATYYIESASYLDADDGYYVVRVTPTSGDIPVATPNVPSGPLASIVGDLAMGDRVINVYFGRAGESFDGIQGEGFTSYERARFQAAFDQIEAVADVEFRVVYNESNADFRLVLDTNEMSYGELGYFYSPGYSEYSGIGVFNGNYFDRYGGGNLESGGLSSATIIHELLHGLGLMHPHDAGGGSSIMAGVSSAFDDFGQGDLNQGVFTTMSYNPGYQFNEANFSENYGSDFGPMALDIAALQLIYGAVDHATDDTSYRLPGANQTGTSWQAIWDTDGFDEILYGGSRDVTIDLREATLRQAQGGGGYLSSVDGIAGGFTIAAGVTIEQARGGSGNDRLSGNSGENVLAGRSGDDTLIGRGRVDRLGGGDGNDDLRGGNGADVLRGNKGGDVLTGGRGADKLIGGAGADVFVFRKVTDSTMEDNRSDTIKGFRSGLDQIDLSQLDSNADRRGDQAFNFNGWQSLNDYDDLGDVGLQRVGDDIRVLIDVDGDGQADMQIMVVNVDRLTAQDFIL